MIHQHSSIGKKVPFFDRREAGELLGEQLYEYTGADKVLVLGIPRGGVPVAAALASKLKLPLILFPCLKINHPADPHQSIGSVCEDDVILHPDSEIPTDIIRHQFSRMQKKINRALSVYGRLPQDLHDVITILVDDRLKNEDTLLACLQSLQKRNAKKIILAVPVITTREKETLRQKGIEVKFLLSAPALEKTETYFERFGEVTDGHIKRLLEKAISSNSTADSGR